MTRMRPVAEDSDEESVEEENKEEVRFKRAAVFHRIEIVNEGSAQVDAKVRIKPKDSTVNFYYPITKCKQIVSRYKRSILNLQKIDLNKDMGNYEIDLELNVTQVVIPMPPPITVPQPPSIADDNRQAQGKAMVETSNGQQVNCPTCTFLNEAGAMYCSICQSSMVSTSSQRT